MPVVIDVPTEDGGLLTVAKFKRNFNGIGSIIYGTCFCSGTKITERFYLFVASFFFIQGTYKSTCTSSNMLRCEVGDLSGKHAMLNVGSGKEFYTDPDLPLYGEMSGKTETM